MKKKKSEIWISAVMYVAIIVVALVIVLEAGLPLLSKLKERAAFSRTTDTMLALDKQIESVASEGMGSQRVVPIEITDGELSVVSNKLSWKLKTDSKLVEPNSKIDMGNVIIISAGTGEAVTANKTGDYFILNNGIIEVNITAKGTAASPVSVNASELINSIEYLSTGAITTGRFVFQIAGDATSDFGTGYSYLVSNGTSIASATVKAHINSTHYEYDLEFTLDATADFLKTRVSKLQVKNG